MLFLVRHGQDLDNSRALINGRRDTPLTALGRSQALAVADALGTKGIRYVYTSPLQRARETASIISDGLGISDLHIDEDLIERDYGILTGRPPADIPKVARKIFEANGFRHVIDSDGVEEYPHLWTRAGNALRRIQDRHGNETGLIVAHNEILRMIRANFENRSWEDELLLPPIFNCQVIALGQQ